MLVTGYSSGIGDHGSHIASHVGPMPPNALLVLSAAAPSTAISALRRLVPRLASVILTTSHIADGYACRIGRGRFRVHGSRAKIVVDAGIVLAARDARCPRSTTLLAAGHIDIAVVLADAISAAVLVSGGR